MMKTLILLIISLGLLQEYIVRTREPFGADGFVSDVECDPDDTPKHGKDLS